MKKKLIIILSVVIAFLAAAFVLLSYLFSPGIKTIEIKENSAGEKVLVIEHGRGEYSTFNYKVEEVMQIDLGESVLEDSEAFGKYRVKITFNDIKFADGFEYGATIKELAKVPNGAGKYNIIAVTHGDSASVIYIGSDEPIKLASEDTNEVKSIRGKIELTFKD